MNVGHLIFDILSLGDFIPDFSKNTFFTVLGTFYSDTNKINSFCHLHFFWSYEVANMINYL